MANNREAQKVIKSLIKRGMFKEATQLSDLFDVGHRGELAPTSPALELFSQRVVRELEQFVHKEMVDSDPAGRLAEAVAHIIKHLADKGYKKHGVKFHELVDASLAEMGKK